MNSALTKILYIGQYSPGTTSKMRADVIKDITSVQQFDIIDTNIPFNKSSRIWRTIGFRYKIGPLINAINNYIHSQLDQFDNISKYEIIWVDKGIYINKRTISRLITLTDRLVHFTPDMAFYENSSVKFKKSMDYYNYLITTKSIEISNYLDLIPKSKLIITTQGYSKNLHVPKHSFEEKDGTVAFIGLAEPHRMQIIEHLIKAGIKVKLAGEGWESFSQSMANNPLFKYHGTGLFSEDYVEFISSASFGLGLLSKKFPELHTTRTFEIPACGTALLTERNKETNKFFNDSNAIFYDNLQDLVRRIEYFNLNQNELRKLSQLGFVNVTDNGYDYHSLLSRILEEVYN